MNDSAYTLHLDPEVPQRNKKGQWNKGGVAWNRGKTWNEMYDKETQERLKEHLRSICRKGCAGKGNAHPKPVIQMDKYGNRLHWYGSSEAAARKLGLIGRNIRKVCDGERNFCGGFKWKWDERFLT